jgi:polysaccharide pyruvyl transferase WcaK-like protein
MHYKNHGVWVGAINQTIDLPGDSLELEVLVQVFNLIDHVTVRDPYSYELLRDAGVKNCQLVPDAAFYCAIPESEEVETVRRQFDLPKEYIALTGSSVLSGKSFEEFYGIYKTVKKKTNMPIVLLGNTKTDFQLSEKVRRLDPSSILISNPATFRQAMAVIAGAEFFVSGRFHPIIFAARAGTAIIPLTANTHKNEGLLKLLEYPVDAIDWHAPAGIERGFEALAESGKTGRQAVQKAAQKLCLETFKIVG